MNQFYIATWRVDGDDFFTTLFTKKHVPENYMRMNGDEWIKFLISFEYKDFERKEIDDMISIATNSDDPNFTGYELLSVIGCDYPVFVF